VNPAPLTLAPASVKISSMLDQVEVDTQAVMVRLPRDHHFQLRMIALRERTSMQQLLSDAAARLIQERAAMEAAAS
jgi:hypothetical protein